MIALFGEECVQLMKQLHHELETKEWQQFQKEKKEGGVLYLRRGDIEVQVGVIGVTNSAGGKVLDRSGEKRVKR